MAFADATISPDGKYLAIAFSKQLCVVQERESGKELFRVKTFAFPFGNEYEAVLGFTPDSRSLIFGNTSRYQHFALPDGKKLQQFYNPHAAPAPSLTTRHAGEYRPSVAFDAESKVMVASNRGHDGKAPTLQLFDVETGRATATLKPLHNRAASAVLSPDGKIVASFGNYSLNDPNRRVFKVEIVDGKEKLTPVEEKTPDEKAKHNGRIVQFWDAVSGKEIGRVQTDGDNSDSGKDSIAADVTAIRFSPDGKTLVAATRADGLFFFDVAKRQKSRQFKRAVDLPDLLEISPDGSVVMEGSFDMGFAIRRFADGEAVKPARPGPLNRLVLGIAIPDPNAAFVFGKFGQRLGWWNAVQPNGGEMPLGHHAPVVGISFDPSGESIRAISRDERHIDWDLKGALKHEGWVDSKRREFFRLGIGVKLSPNGKRVLKRQGDGSWEVRDLLTEKSLIDIPRSGRSLSVAFSPQSDAVVVADGKSVRTIDIAGGQVESNHKIDLDPDFDIAGVAIAPDRKWLAVITSELRPFNRKSVLHVIDNESGKVHKRLDIGWPALALFSPGGRELAVIDSSPRILDAASLKVRPIAVQRLGPPTALAYSPDGKTIAIATWKGAATDEQAEIVLVESSTGMVRRRFQGHHGPILALAFSPNNSMLASGGEDNIIHLWRNDIEK